MARDGQVLELVTVGRCSVDLHGEQVGGRPEDVASFAEHVGGSPTTAPGGGAFPVRLIPPEEVGRSRRGTGGNLRRVRDIPPEGRPWAHRLLVVEVVTPAGHGSSYPPHDEHDADDPPREARPEGACYHRLDPALVVGDGDVGLVPAGYHPCAAAPPGRGLCYLNALAGPERAWRSTTEPQHRWRLG